MPAEGPVGGRTPTAHVPETSTIHRFAILVGGLQGLTTRGAPVLRRAASLRRKTIMQQLRNSARGMLVGALTMLAMGTGIDFAVGQSPLRQSADAIWTSAERATIEGDIANAWIRPRGVSRGDARHQPPDRGAGRRGARISRRSPRRAGPDYAAHARRVVRRLSVCGSTGDGPGTGRQDPEIRTYLGQGIDDPAASVRFDFTPAGFHAQILSPRGAVYIDPLNRADVLHYASYRKRDLTSSGRATGLYAFSQSGRGA
jgi:hypothetical protein